MEEVDPSPAFLAEFVRAIAVLALPAEHQISWIEGLGVETESVDELALEFDDGYRMLPRFLELRWLPDGVRGPADDIDRLLTQMSGADGPWAFEDLRKNERWAEVRSIGVRALREIDGSTFIQ